jgi:hypothetical protein
MLFNRASFKTSLVTMEPCGLQISTDGFANDGMQNTQEYGPLVDRASRELLSLEATGLNNRTTYQIRVRILSPFIADWPSAFSSSVVEARPSLPPTSVTNLEATSATLNSVVFTWQAPVGVQVTSYLVSWTPNDNSTVINGTAMSYNLTGISPGIIYTLRVRGRNLNWRGYESGATATGTAQGPPLPPRSLRLTGVLRDGIDIRWDSPQAGSAPTAYVVQCRTLHDPTPMRLYSTNCLSGPSTSAAPFIPVIDSLAASARTARVQGLMMGRTYQFRLCARGLSIAGLVCGGYVTGVPSDPLHPVTLQLESVTMDSITCVTCVCRTKVACYEGIRRRFILAACTFF